jgi:prepilin-type N-terminal cleavage/methylation domain-containing protein
VYPLTGPQASRQAGFTLLEVIMVLGIIGVLASVILPNISLGGASQMSMSLRDLTGHLRATYDSAVLTGQVHRVVIQPKKRIYWSEAAPLGISISRPPSFEGADSSEATRKEQDREKLLEELNEVEKEPRQSADAKRIYQSRSILVLRKSVLKPIKWLTVEDSVLKKRQLHGSIAFASIFAENMQEKWELQNANESEPISLYFFPSGETLQAQLQLGLADAQGTLVAGGPQYTVVLDALTGQSELLEGFQDAEFVKSNK